MNLFIDTNRYLNLYALSQTELKDLERLIELVDEGKITLWLPEQVKNEFYRNREERVLNYHQKIHKLIAEYDMEESSNPDIPECEQHLEKIVEAQKTIIEEKNKIKTILERIKKDFEDKIKKSSFFADEIVERLFLSATGIPAEKKILDKAITRNNLGNPPGKTGSFGDPVIWESLLDKIPKGEDLYFVGGDKDFKSKLDKNDFLPFLEKEWEEKKNSKVIMYKHLGEFTKDKIPEIKTSDNIIEGETKIDKEYERSSFIQEMANIGSIYTSVAENISNISQIQSLAERMANISSVYQIQSLAERMANISSVYQIQSLAARMANISSRYNTIAEETSKKKKTENK